MTALNRAITQAKHLEKSAREILIEKGVIQKTENVSVPASLQTYRESVAAVIVPEAWREYKRHPLDIPVVMGVGGKNKDALEFIGGGIDSEEEKSVKASFENKDEIDPLLLINGNIPQHLYFLLQGRYMLERGELLQCTYDLREGIRSILGRELHREISEETGVATGTHLTLHNVFDVDPKETNLLTASFGPFTQEIGEKYKEKVTLQEGKLRGVVITIRERGILATTENTEALISVAEETEEVRGLISITLGELFERGRQATESVDSWNSYGFGKPRNDSVFYHARALLEHLKKQ